jgi:hypothetical protein
MTNKHKMFAFLRVFLAVLAPTLMFAQQPDFGGSTGDSVKVEVGRAGHPLPSHRVAQEKIVGYQEVYHPNWFAHYILGRHSRYEQIVRMNPVAPEWANFTYHPVLVVARHPKAGCSDTAVCGEIFHWEKTHNLRTSAGATWQYDQMAGGTVAVGTYMALTNTAITPAYADTTLSGEITSNGLARALATPSNGSTTLAVPAAPTATANGTTGSTTYYYWPAACSTAFPTPICTATSATSGSVTNANATLSASNSVGVVWTGQLGATSYQLWRTTSNTAPSGTVSDLVGGTASCTVANPPVCTQYDISNTLTSATVGTTANTYYGKYTLVYTWTATASQSAQAGAVFNASSSGTDIFEFTFSSVSLNNGDTLQVTESVYI